MVEENIIKCIRSILDNGVVFIEELRTEIRAVAEYLEKFSSSLEILEQFLEHYDKEFMVENDKVCVYSSHLDSGRNKAVEYYEAELKKYGERPDCFNFRGHIGQASQDIKDYLNTFYPLEDFKDFLLGYPDVFVVFDDDTVSLIDLECVNYFKRFLQDGGIPLNMLQKYTFGAPDHIKKFMDEHYYGDYFLDFLKENPKIFYVEDGYVYLN